MQIMKNIILVGLNTRHTHSSLALASLQAFWNRLPGRQQINRLDFDLNQNLDSLINELILRKPTMVGFSTYIWNLHQTVTTAGSIKAAFPETLILLGGPEVSFQSRLIMQRYPWVDVVVRGEGEKTLEDLILHHLDDFEIEKIQGIDYRENDRLYSTTDRPLIENLDVIPSPFQIGIYGLGKGFTYYESSRGCPFKCSYCLSSVLGNVRYFSLERVFADLDWFMKSEYTQIRFADRTFNLDQKRALRIIEYIIRNNKKRINFHFEIKADILSDEIIDLFAQAPADFFHLEIGVQSTHSPALQAVARTADLENAGRKIRQLINRTKCHIHLDLLAGLPHEDFKNFKKTLNETFSWTPTSIQVGMVKVLHGTSLENAVKSGDISCAPLPLYQVVKSRWLDPDELILILDMGKLVEGIFNPGKFKNTLLLLARFIFDGDLSNLFEHLARYWRGTGKPFFQFSPDNIYRAILDYVSNTALAQPLKMAIESMLLHEFRLTQKVPSGKSAETNHVSKEHAKAQYKLRPGLKSFWYEIDPLTIMEQKDIQAIVIKPAPVIYSYETDLSRIPNTFIIAKSLRDRLVLQLIGNTADMEEMLTLLNKHCDSHENLNKLRIIIDDLIREDFIIDKKNPRTKTKKT